MASGGIAPYTYSVGGGAIPPGTTLDPTTGTVSGTPTTAGSFAYTIRVTDSNAPANTVQENVSGSVTPVFLSLAVTPSAVTQVGQPYSQTSLASGGIAPYIYSIDAGAVPPGTTLDTATGTVSGTPTTGGGFSYTIKVTDHDAKTATRAVGGSIGLPPALSLAVTPSATAQIGEFYTQTSLASGGIAPYTYSLGGAVPLGTTLDTATGTVSGTPVTAGAFSYIISVTDSAAQTASQSVNGTVTPAALSLVVTPSTTTQVGQFYAQTSLASGGTAPYSYSIGGGVIPPGTTLNTANGAVLGTPTAAGGFSYVMTVTDSAAQTRTQSVSGTVAPVVLVFSPPSGSALPRGMAGEAYSQAISVTNGMGAVTYAHTGGAMPPDMILNQTTGELTVAQDDARAKPGSYTFTITATDASANTEAATYTLELVSGGVTVRNRLIVITPGGTPLPVDLTEGATGGPFTAGFIGAVTPPNAGIARVTSGDVAGPAPAGPLRFYLKFTPNPEFSGTAVVDYTLVSALGTASGKVSFTSTLDIAKVAERFDGLVHGFIDTRQRLLATGIAVPGLLEHRAMVSGKRPGTLGITPNGNSIAMNFASSLAELKAWGEAGDAAGTLASMPGSQPLPFNIWLDGTATVHLRSDDTEDHWGKFALISVGTDYLVNDKLLVGIALHADFMDDLTHTSSTSGTGILAGPYLSTEIGDGVFLDASVFYGRSWNQVSTDIFGGDFQSQRLVARAKLEGEWSLGDSLAFRPNVTAFYLHETVDEYSVSNAIGEAVTLAGFTSDQLRLSAGGVFEFETQIGDALTLKPYLGGSLGLASVSGTTATGGAFGALTTGFTLFGTDDWNIGAGLEFGLEASGLKTATAKGKLQVNF